MAYRIGLVGIDGCMTSAITGLEDAFAIASEQHRLRGGGDPPFEVMLVTTEGTPAHCFGGRTLDARTSLGAVGTLDVVVVPPVLRDITKALQHHAELRPWLADQSESGAVVASVCTGAFFLAEAGLLDGRRATTNPLAAQLLSERYSRIHVDPNMRLVDEGQVITVGSTTAFLDLAIHLVKRLISHEIAVLTAKVLVKDLSQDSQRPYFLFTHPKAHGDADILSLQNWMEEHYADHANVSDLARRAGMSTRSLNRRFRSATGYAPVAYLHQLRIEAAKHMLESTASNVSEITHAVGYEDSRSFSRLFSRLTGLSPREYRRRFGASS